MHELPRRIAAITRYFNALVIFFSIYVIDLSTLVIVHVALHLAYSSTICFLIFSKESTEGSQ